MSDAFGGHGGGGLGRHARQGACLQGLPAWLRAIGGLAATGREDPLGTCGGWRGGVRVVSTVGEHPHDGAAQNQTAVAVDREQQVHFRAQRGRPGEGWRAGEDH